jgi:hypothetical protein
MGSSDLPTLGNGGWLSLIALHPLSRRKDIQVQHITDLPSVFFRFRHCEFLFEQFNPLGPCVLGTGTTN